MAELKVGDIVKYTSGRHGDSEENPLWECTQGKIEGTIVNDNGSDGLRYRVSWRNGKTNLYALHDLKLITDDKIKNTMTIIEKFQLATKSEPEKTFIEQGICNMNGSLTTDGQQLFMAWLLKSNGDAFKTEVVDVMIKNDAK